MTTNYRVVESELKRKLHAGAITQDDIADAAEVARALGSTASRVLFANIKKQAELNEANKPEETEESTD